MKDRVVFALDRREIILLVVVLLVFSLAVFFLGFLAGSGRCKGKVTATSTPQKVEKIVVTPATETHKGIEYTFVTTGGTEAITVSEPVTGEEVQVSGKKTEVASQAEESTEKVKQVSTSKQPEKPTSPGKEKVVHTSASTKRSTGKKVAPPPVKVKRPFTVQVAAYRVKKDALLLVYRLRKAGFDAFYERTNIPGKGVWYRVRVGHYRTREEAKRWAEKIHRKMGLPTFVTISK